MQGDLQDPSSALPRYRWNQEISISGSWCVGLWMLGLLLNGLVLTRGHFNPSAG